MQEEFLLQFLAEFLGHERFVVRRHIDAEFCLLTVAKEYGLDLKVALGIHPANALENNEIIFNELEKWFLNGFQGTNTLIH